MICCDPDTNLIYLFVGILIVYLRTYAHRYAKVSIFFNQTSRNQKRWSPIYPGQHDSSSPKEQKQKVSFFLMHQKISKRISPFADTSKLKQLSFGNGGTIKTKTPAAP
jgi:hypothetical protein